MDADLWISNNVKVGWIAEVLRLLLAEALIPIVERALQDGAKAEGARIRKALLLEAADIMYGPSDSALRDALNRICPENDD